MRREARITAGEDYRRIYEHGRSAVNRDIVVYYLHGDAPGVRLGVSVSRKLGSAVARNRIRRLVKEAFRKNETKIKSGYDIVVIARHAVKGKSFHDVEKTFIDVLAKARLLKENENDTNSSN